ncbi:MAG TPA: ADOP family duplicated permease [Terriglobales bacterium]|nr:ADOP family duplicated permease [Terriglobales bacterium]
MTARTIDESERDAGIRYLTKTATALFRDFRVALRSLGRAPALWVTVALTLALSIGANTAIFSVVRSVLLRPLVNRDEDRLIYIQQRAPGLQVENATFSIPEITDIGANLKTIGDLGTFSTVDFTAQGFGETREIHAGVVDGAYFEVMGLKPVLGRLLDPRDDGPYAAGAAVLTYKFWVTGLRADPNVIGKVIRLGSMMQVRSATIVGVLEPSIPYPAETEIIANIVTSPHHLSATMVQGREHRMTDVFGRLAPGANLKSARAELRTVYAGMTAAHPEVYKPQYHFEIDARRLRDQINAEASTILWLLFGASGLLFVIACSNVANLILARTVRRESELSVRAALGASSAALRRSLLAEGLLLCGSGGLAGVLVAIPMVSVLVRYALRFSVRAADLTVDFSLLWMGLALALAAAFFLAFVPRLPSADSSRGLGLTSGSNRVTGSSRRRIRVFTVIQIAASFLLMASAGVLLRTLLSLRKAQPGFETGHVLIANLPLISDGRTPQQVAELYQEAQRSVTALSGVEGAATGMFAPWRDGRFLTFTLQFSVEGRPRESSKEDLRARFRFVSPGYFATLGIPLVEGRDFTEADRKGAEPVVIVSKSIADQLFSGQDALNRHVMWTDPLIKYADISPEPCRIVGVLANVDDANIIPQPNMTVYSPFAQGPIFGANLLVRTKSDPYALVPTITKTIRAAAATQPVENASTLQDVRTEVLANNRVNAIVFGGFAALALAISIVGVAGVLAFAVSLRTREFGIRLALGAQPSRILAGVLIDGETIAAIGVVAGGLVGWGLSRLAGNYIPELKLPEPLLLIASAAVIFAAAAMASLVPAARAARVDAVQALRAE